MDEHLLAALRAVGFDIAPQRDSGEGYTVTTDVGQWGVFKDEREALVEGVRALIQRALEADPDPDIAP